MKALTLTADFAPKPDYQLNERERTTHRIQAGSQVWKNPHIAVGQSADPKPKDDEVIIKVGAVGICGSDMHMYEAGKDGYILYTPV